MGEPASDEQMQSFSDQRIRVRAEQFRALRAACVDDKNSIEDIYARAIGPNEWHDNRTDPPHKLQSAGGVSPDDMLNFNSVISLFDQFCEGTFSNVQQANSAAAQLQVLLRACVRPIST